MSGVYTDVACKPRSEQTKTVRMMKFLFFANAHLKTKLPTLKWHIWFLPTHKPTLRKTKRAIFCHRSRKYSFITENRKPNSILIYKFQP